MVDWQFFALLLSNGILIGLMYSLIALGFVLVYKATDAINFAQGHFVMISWFLVFRFLLLTKDLDADDAEVTRTRKVRRRHVAEKYAAVTDAFYGGRDEVELATTITYEDGRQATLRSRVRIEDVQGVPLHG